MLLYWYNNEEMNLKTLPMLPQKNNATTKECNRRCMQWAKMKKLVLLMFHEKRPLLMYHKERIVMMLQKCCNNGLDESLYEKVSAKDQWKVTLWAWRNNEMLWSWTLAQKENKMIIP